MMKKTISFLLILLMLLSLSPAMADVSYSMKDDGFSTSYSYIYDYWGDEQECPDPYRVTTVIDSMTLGLDKLEGKRISRPQSLFVHGNDLYIADTFNNRILQVHYDGREYSLTRVISQVNGTEPATFNNPYDIAVDDEENIYVADYLNYRVVMMCPWREYQQGLHQIRSRHDVYRLYRRECRHLQHGGIYLETVFHDAGTARRIPEFRTYRI